jgi:AcrR family transcriptional regulator
MSADESRSTTSARITTAAFALLAERGLTGVTMSAIATRAGVARQTLYNHFADVDSILAAGITQSHRGDLQALATMLATIPTAVGRLEHLVRHTTVTAAQHGTIPSLGEGLSPAVQETTRHYDEQIRQLIREALDEGRRAGEIPDTIDPDRDAVLFHHLLRGCAELAAADPADVASIVDAATRLIRAATVNRAGPSP